MINWDSINNRINIKKVILPLFVVILTLIIIIFLTIIINKQKSNEFVKSYEILAEKNKEPKFSIDKIYICSSANAVDTTSEHNLDILELYQYTDIAIYLNNHNEEGLNNLNTVKELCIDNIEINLLNDAENGTGKSGETRLFYTNLLKIGSKDEIKKIIGNKIENNSIVLPEEQKRINFEIISNNKENEEADYDKPTFYADCSNPISLKYINKLNKKYSLGTSNLATFDGSILEKAGVTIDDLECRIKFKINIKSHDDEYHSSWVNFKLPLNDIYDGTSIKSKTMANNNFFVGDGSF